MPDRESSEALMEVVYDELRDVAERYFRRQPAGFTMRPTEIVHEACMHLMQHGNIEWTSANHFRAIAIRKIWQIIVDHLKKRQAKKRGGAGVVQPSKYSSDPGSELASKERGWKRIPLEHVTIEWRDRAVELIDLADLLSALREESSRLHDVVMLHWFGGMTHAEVAEELDVSTSTAEKDFRYALAWLNQRLEQTNG
ncbi:MAG: extracytoplasmic sigma factor ECF [Phycisphaerae bacterium]|nr:MAG: extracytoplasmic sigma factor ECF [Phycisphaerae bacterium]